MDAKEKLVGLLKKTEINKINGHTALAETCFTPNVFENMATNLIAHGVTVQELDGCFRCKDSQEMTVTISNKLIDGVNIGWLGGNLPARYCPFCGRRLPQPPKGE